MELIRRERVLSIPNLLTVVRIGLLPAVVWRFRRGDSVGALTVYLVSMLTDVVDGFIARRFHQETSLGKLLDPVADKLSLLTLIWLFVADGQIQPWVLALVLVKELLLVAGSGFALQKGIVVRALPIGKATTLVFVLSMTARFLGWRIAADLMLVIALFLSAAALVWYYAVVLVGMKRNEVETSPYHV